MELASDILNPFGLGQENQTNLLMPLLLGALMNRGTEGASPLASGTPDSISASGGRVDPALLYKGLIQRGLSPAQASATLGNWQQESNFNLGALNPKEGAYGLDQWRLGRRDALDAMAKERGVDPSDPNLQLDYYMKELHGTPAGQKFLASKDLGEANQALKSFIAYGDDSEGTRLANAQRFAKEFGTPGATGEFAGEAPATTNDLMPQETTSKGDAPEGGQFPAAPKSASGAGGRSDLLRLMLLSSLGGMRLQPVDYDPYKIMPHFEG